MGNNSKRVDSDENSKSSFTSSCNYNIEKYNIFKEYDIKVTCLKTVSVGSNMKLLCCLFDIRSFSYQSELLMYDIETGEVEKKVLSKTGLLSIGLFGTFILCGNNRGEILFFDTTNELSLSLKLVIPPTSIDDINLMNNDVVKVVTIDYNTIVAASSLLAHGDKNIARVTKISNFLNKKEPKFVVLYDPGRIPRKLNPCVIQFQTEKRSILIGCARGRELVKFDLDKEKKVKSFKHEKSRTSNNSVLFPDLILHLKSFLVSNNEEKIASISEFGNYVSKIRLWTVDGKLLSSTVLSGETPRFVFDRPIDSYGTFHSILQISEDCLLLGGILGNFILLHLGDEEKVKEKKTETRIKLEVLHEGEKGKNIYCEAWDHQMVWVSKQEKKIVFVVSGMTDDTKYGIAMYSIDVSRSNYKKEDDENYIMSFSPPVLYLGNKNDDYLKERLQLLQDLNDVLSFFEIKVGDPKNHLKVFYFLLWGN